MIAFPRETGRPVRENAAFAIGPSRRPATRREIEIFLAIVEHSDARRAAASLGISRETVTDALSRLYERLGAENRTHAAWLLYPIIGDRYRLPTRPDAEAMARERRARRPRVFRP